MLTRGCMAVLLSARGPLAIFGFLAWSAAVPSTQCWAAYPTAVNTQIVDAVTQANVMATSTSLPTTMASFYQSSAQSIANAATNASVAQQQSMVTAQAASTMGIAQLYSVDTSSSAMATKAILGVPSFAGQSLRSISSLPREGIMAGVSLLMFNINGNAAPFADYYLITDEGYDYYIDQDQNLILFAHNVRTIGDAPFAATDVGFVLPQASVSQYFPQLLESSPSVSSRLGETSVADEVEPLRDIYFGVKYADGSTNFYEASLKLPIVVVPEPSSFVLALAGGVAAFVGRTRFFGRRK